MSPVGLRIVPFGIIVDGGLKFFQAGGKPVSVFPNVPCLIACGLNDSRQKCRWIRSIRRCCGSARNALPRATGEHHRATWRADGTDHRAHGVEMGEGHAAYDERIEIGRLEQRVAERVQTVGAMVIGVDVEDVGATFRRWQQRSHHCNQCEAKQKSE